MAASKVVSVWRIAKHMGQFQAADLTGASAESTEGRWNSEGNALVYASTSIALATLETLVHLSKEASAIRNAFLVKISMPTTVWNRREIVEAKDLPATWLAEPPGSTTVDYGDAWLKRVSSCVLLVPSVIVPEEYNALINPAHPRAASISASVLRQYIYDPRLH